MSSQTRGASEVMDLYSYPDSVSSSPRSVGRASRGTVDSEYSAPPHHNQRWDQHQESSRGSGGVRFMCSYGGRILPRPHDNELRYVGGDTRIVAVARNVSYSFLISRLSKLCGSTVTLKYQLPNEDLDALISVTTDEDLENMMEEYDRLQQSEAINNSKSLSSSSSSRLRLFLFPAKPESATSSLGPLLEGSKGEHWFVDALNGVPVLTRGGSEVSSVVSENLDYLFGFDGIEDSDRIANQNQLQSAGKSRLSLQHGEGLNPRSDEEVYSVPVSPLPDSSPHCSTYSALPCMEPHVAPIEPQQAGGIEMGKEGFDPLTSEGIADHETRKEGFDPLTSESIADHETRKEGFDPLTSEGIADHETRAALASSALQTQDPSLVLDDHMTKIRPAEAFQQVQFSKQEQDASEGRSQIQLDFGGPMRREGSSLSLASMNRQGSVSNLPDDSRYPHDTTVVQLKQQNSKYPDETTSTMIQQQQQIPAEHYMEQSYPYTYPYPQPYWQVHDPHSDQAVPFYMLPTRPVPSAVCPTVQPPCMPLQQIGPIAPITAPAVYSAEMLTSRSAVPPLATIRTTQKAVTKQGPSYPAKAAASKVPLHRARSVVTDMRTMMRPSQPPFMYIPQDQYGYQQVVYETNPAPHVYHSQMGAVMMPQYQTMGPVATDLQTSFQAVPKDPKLPKLARVGQSL